MTITTTTHARRVALTTGAIVAATLLVAPVASAERMSDKDVKELIERVDHERDRFEDQLDGTIKRSILRGPRGEVNVERYLDDLQENLGRLKERFKPDYSASSEVTAVLRQGSDIQRYMSAQKPNFDGASEWNRLASSLGELAAAYGTTFPLPEGQAARRLNDVELRRAADDVAKSADRFKKELDNSLKKDKTVDQKTREAAVREVDGVKQDAQKLASVLGDNRPASGEAQALLDRAAKVQAAGAGQPLSTSAKTAWGSVQQNLDKVAQAFGLSTRS